MTPVPGLKFSLRHTRRLARIGVRRGVKHVGRPRRYAADMSVTGEPGPYRWVVMRVSTTVNALAWAARSTFALFYVAILDEFAWGRGPTALGYPVNAWLIVTLGWQTALMAFGSIVAASSVSLALLYRDPPIDEERSCETGVSAVRSGRSS